MQSVITGRPIGRPKQFYKYELPQGVIKVVRAQCADYDRKALAIREGNIAAETLQSYIKTNEAIDKALDEIEEGCRADFLIGYDRSGGAGLSACGRVPPPWCEGGYGRHSRHASS